MAVGMTNVNVGTTIQVGEEDGMEGAPLVVAAEVGCEGGG